MNYCTKCGHELGVGRFCTNCGTPVPGRHPDAAPHAPHARPHDPVSPATAATLAPQPPTAYLPGVRSVRGLVIAAVLLAIVVIGAAWAALIIFNSDGSKAKDTAPAPEPSVVTTTARPTRTATPTSPTSTGADLAGEVTDVQVPGTAPASTDLAGHKVTFGAMNLVDGDAQTAWRMAGDGAGGSITITFGKPVTLTSVGLVNGYAKKYPGYNGYWLNRKITQVRWTLEDGSTVTQNLRRVTRMQTMDVDAGPTSSLKLDIVTTVPSNKPNGRDYTAISELALAGSAS